MPDYVYNYLHITGPEESIEKFRDTVCCKENGRDIINFEKTLPMPDDKAVEKANTNNAIRIAYGVPEWHLWCVEHYGTRTTIPPLCIDEEKDDGWLFSFDTAWSPCNKWVYNTASHFPELTFKNAFIRHGMEAGECTVWTEDGDTFYEEVGMTEHDFKMKYEPGYAEEYKSITEGDYKKFLDFFVENDPEYNEMEEEIVRRIKDEDLPLFVNKEWETGPAQNLFESRLKGDK